MVSRRSIWGADSKNVYSGMFRQRKPQTETIDEGISFFLVHQKVVGSNPDL